MSVRTFTPDELRATGSLKWTGITRSNGQPTIGAWVAEMDFGTAPHIVRTIKDAIDRGFLGYPPPWLAQAIREATARFQQTRFNWSIQAEDVRLVSSVLPALRATITHMVPPGAPIIVPTPAYMPFLTIPQQLGHPVIEVPSLRSHDPDQHDWQLDIEAIRRGLEQGAGLVILCNPWNPTGRVLTREELEVFGTLVSRYDALVFSDEIHSPLILDPDATFTSYARVNPQFAAHTITATAASKGWNIAALPCAQVILPDEQLRERWDVFGEDIAHEANILGTLATITAYTQSDSWQREVLEIVRANIDNAERAIAGAPVDFSRPEATYLTWWGFEDLHLGERTPAEALREGPGIAVNPGATLGREYTRWARINFACAPQVAEEIIRGILSVVEHASR